MVNIKVRRVFPYVEVKIEFGDTLVDLGFLGLEEIDELCEVLMEAWIELEAHFDYIKSNTQREDS